MIGRVAKLKHFIDHLDLSKPISFTLWASLLGKLVSFAMLHRGILSQFNLVYRQTPKSLPSSRGNPAKHNILVSKPQPKEVRDILSLLSLAKVTLNLPFSTTVVAVDASHIADAVVYAEVSVRDAVFLWDIAVRRKATKNPTSLCNPPLEEFVAK